MTAALMELAEAIATDMENFAEGMYQGGSALFDFADRVRALGAAATVPVIAEPVGFRFRVLGEEHRDRPWTGSGIVAEWNKPVPTDNETIQYQALYTQLRAAASGVGEAVGYVCQDGSVTFYVDDFVYSRQPTAGTVLYAHPGAEARDAWLPIESAEDGVRNVLVYAGGAVGEASHHGEDGWWWVNNDPTDHWGDRIYPTHWKQLPPPPSEEAALRARAVE